MVDHKSCLTYATHGGYSAVYAASTEGTTSTNRHCRNSFCSVSRGKEESAIGLEIVKMCSIRFSDWQP